MEPLNINATAEEKEEYLKKAILEREQDPLKMISAFESIVAWLEAHDENTSDMLGHLCICLNNAGRMETNPEAKQTLQDKAVETAKASIDKAENDGAKAISYTNLSSCLVDQEKYDEAEEAIDKALDNLPGSKAHRAWAGNQKLQIIWAAGKRDDAWKFLDECKNWIREGYEEEIKNDDGEHKLLVWFTGLMLTEAKMHHESNRDILAQMILESIINLPDEKGFLAFRIKQAKKDLDQLKA